MTDAINEQIDGKSVSISIEPKVDDRAAQAAGKKTKETVERQTADVKVTPKVDQRAADKAGETVTKTVEKHTDNITVEPKVDQRAAEAAGKTTGDAVTKGASESLNGAGDAITGALIKAGSGAGTRLGELLADTIPTGMTGASQRIGDVLYNTLPAVGASVGALAGGAIGKAVTDAISGTRFQDAGQAVKRGLVGAVDKANTGVDIGIKVGNSLAGGLTKTSGAIDGAAAKLTDTIGGIGGAVTTTMGLLGADDTWAAPGLDILNAALGTATPLLEGMSAASTLATAGAQTISVATGAASKAQMLWNAALIANPIGLLVAAIGAVVAGLVLFFTKTETGRQIWAAFTDFLSAAWEKVTGAFRTAWTAIFAIFDAVVAKVTEVWTGVRDRFNKIVDFVKGLPRAITNASDRMWDGLKAGLLSVLNWISDKWNSFADGLSFHLPGTNIDVKMPKLPKFAGGGYTGNTGIDKVAGVVHGGEHVIKADSRKRIENAYPGLLDYLNNNGKLPGLLPGYQGGGLVAGTEQLRKIISERFGITNIGGYRAEDGYGEHSTGRALDVMTTTQGDAVKDFAIANAAAIDLKWAIWKQRMWYPDGSSKPMADRGSPTQNHMDHVHIFSGPGIINGLRGSLKPKEAERDAAAPATPGGAAQGPVVGPAQTDAAPASASGGGGGASVPSSISGLASFGLNNLGAGVGATSSGSDLSVFGKAAGAAVSGQVSSALGVLGVGDSPGWLQGIGKLVGGISVSGKNGQKIFGGGAAGGALFGGSQRSAAPIAAAPTTAPQATGVGAVHGSAGGQRPGPPGAQYFIRTATVEDAFLVAQRRENELNAAKLSRF
ncbi:phage tail protein [Mycobacterium sp. CSUR Q5927]|nr:phage tail protein [Mycobacterium sp. CSUR Q5927]